MGLGRRQVDVAPEEVGRVVTGLERQESLVVRAVGCLSSGGLVGVEVVHVSGVRQMRAQRLVGSAHPGDVGVVLGGVEPLADEDDVVAGLAVG